MVVVDREGYIHTAKHLLQQPTYWTILSGPANNYQAKLINILKKLKVESGIDKITYKRIYPTGASYSEFYGLPKIHKKDTPSDP